MNDIERVTIELALSFARQRGPGSGVLVVAGNPEIRKRLWSAFNTRRDAERAAVNRIRTVLPGEEFGWETCFDALVRDGVLTEAGDPPLAVRPSEQTACVQSRKD